MSTTNRRPRHSSFGKDLNPDLHVGLYAQYQDPEWFHAEVTDVEGRLTLEPDRVVVDHGQRHVVLDGSSHGPEGEVAPDKEAAMVCARYHSREHTADGRVSPCVDTLLEFAILEPVSRRQSVDRERQLGSRVG